MYRIPPLGVQISALRKLFGANAITTVAGRGYRFVQTGLEIQELGVPTPIATDPALSLAASPRATAANPIASTPFESTPNSRAPERRKAVTLPDDNLALPDKPSIAVLPFANFSCEAGLAHFTDGLTEDIITELSRFRSLFVISRNSAFTFKNRPVDVSTVARELGVRYVLEGSVRHAKMDNLRVRRLRVTSKPKPGAYGVTMRIGASERFYAPLTSCKTPGWQPQRL